MKHLLWFLVLFSIAAAVALSVSANTGYVLIVVAPWRIEISLALFVILLVVALLGLYGLSRLLFSAFNLPDRIHAYRLRRSRNRARNALYQGFAAYFEGNFKKAERQAELALESHESTALSAVLAARSAHELRRFDARDQYLDQALQAGPETRLMALNTQAELMLEDRRHTDALQVLQQSQKIAPKQTRVHQLLLRARVATGAWKTVVENVEQLRHLDGIDANQAHRILRNAWQQLLRQHAHRGQELTTLWKTIPAELRDDSILTRSMAGYLIDQGRCKEAQNLLERHLEQHWETSLVALYGKCPSDNSRAQIERAEKWLESHPDNAALLLALARLCMRQSLWGKSQSYLDASLSLEQSHDAQEFKQQLAAHIQAIRPPTAGVMSRTE